MAKAPVAGRVKTRLCPPCTPAEAAELALACLQDSLAAVQESVADCRLVALDGRPGDWLPAGFDVVAQRGSGLAERLDHAVSLVGEGSLLIVGMDTPQLTSALLIESFDALRDAETALGACTDGGWWGLAARAAYPGMFDDVPMSTAITAARQLARLNQLGLRTAALPVLTDVDDFPDALAVAALVPRSRFARRMSRLTGVRLPA